ncbi:7417_t:CDS:1, partial [Funneliformis geosporum]
MEYHQYDLNHYIIDEFNYIPWCKKLYTLHSITTGLEYIHNSETVHRDLHGGNILIVRNFSVLCDLGLSRSSIESAKDAQGDSEIYGVVPYVAPEIFEGKKYTMASDVYSFGMIMWEFMNGRRPFCDKKHDAELIVEICDGLRPSIVTNAPIGYIELMRECWDHDPLKRPVAAEITKRINDMWEFERKAATEIYRNCEIGPTRLKHPEAIYTSRLLSGLIKSAMFVMSIKSLKNQSVTSITSNNNAL